MWPDWRRAGRVSPATWTSPLLFVTNAAIGAGGLFAFSMICNTALHVVVATSGGARPRAQGEVEPTQSQLTQARQLYADIGLPDAEHITRHQS